MWQHGSILDLPQNESIDGFLPSVAMDETGIVCLLKQQQDLYLSLGFLAFLPWLMFLGGRKSTSENLNELLL